VRSLGWAVSAMAMFSAMLAFVVMPDRHHRHFRVAPDPAEGPFAGVRRWGIRPRFPEWPVERATRPACPRARFHNDHPDVPGGGVFQAPGAGLIFRVQEIVLNLAEFPGIGVDDPREVVDKP
jgi:hypothetical protein